MNKDERFELIRSRLSQWGSIDGDELARELNTSKATIRRDLDAMEELGFLKRTHGGARLVEDEKNNVYNLKLALNLSEKRAIGNLASSFLEEGKMVACTGGTTVMQTVKALKGKRITIVTNAVNIATELVSEELVEVILTGGKRRSGSYELEGHIAERTIRDFHFDIALLGVDGISLEHGLSSLSVIDAHMASLFISNAQEIWVVADHNKFGRTAPALIAPLDRRMRIFTDSGIDPVMAKLLSDKIFRIDTAELRQ